MTYIPALLEIRTLDSLGNQVTLVDLLNNGNGIILSSWRPKRAAMKGGGVYQDSPYADGRRLVQAVYDNVSEALVLLMANDAPDSTFYHDGLLTRALQDAIDYGRNTWGSQPVFLAMKPRGGTNEQYALIVNGRTEEFADPFGSLAYQFKAPRNIADEIPLVIEREHWLEVPPTLGVATELSAVQAFPETFALSFSSSTDLITAGSDASIDNLTVAAGGFTAEAWVKLDRLPTAVARILLKGQWALQVTTAGKVSAFIAAATTSADATGTPTTLTDLGWHHVAMTYLNTGARTIQLWIDGFEVAYDSQVAASGALTSDAASTLFMGPNFTGLIGWMRLSSTRRYTAAFTPPSRCAPPAIDASTEAQWNMREGRGTVVDNAEGTAGSDGTITGAIWSSARIDGSACGLRNYGNVNSSGVRVPTTSNQVYVSNKHTSSQITNWHIGTAGSNRIDLSFPTALHTVTITEATYFGVSSSFSNIGPFDSLVFDIATAQVGATLVWEYWNGAWVGLTVTDNTVSFTVTGVNSVHWIPPSDWVAAAPSGSIPTGYYVRVRTTVVGSVNPTQQNRNPYTICWPYVEIQAAAVPGEIQALARLKLFGQSGQDTTNPAPKTIHMGLRSVSRGGAFTPYINLADTQAVPGVSTSLFLSAAYVTDLYAPSGRSVSLPKTGGGGSPTNTYLTAFFRETIASQYRGKFRAFMRYRYDGTSTVHNVRLLFGVDNQSLYSNLILETEVLTTAAGANALYTLDFGEVTIPEYVEEFVVAVVANGGSNTTNQMFIADLILLPVDEWTARFDDPLPTGSSVTYGVTKHLTTKTASGVVPGNYLDINHLITKKSLSELAVRDSDITKVLFTPQVSQVFFQNSEKQRIWFFQHGEPATTLAPGRGRPFYSLSVQAFRNAQYLGIRGNQ